jgi:hypothetical protein
MTTAVLLALVAGVLSVAAAAPRVRSAARHDRCGVQRLPLPDGYAPPSVITAGDRTGRFLVGEARSEDPAGTPLLLWDREKPVPVSVPGVGAELTNVNSSGVAVGHALGSDGALFSFLYHDGIVTPMRGRGSVAVALNERGVAAGYAGTRPVWWPGPTAEPEPLALPGNDWRGEALAIGDDGVIVGRVWPPPPATSSRAYAWFPDGSHRELPGGAAIASAYRDGWVVGTTGGPASAAVRWNLRDRNAMPAPIGSSKPHVVNASGTAAGAGRPALFVAPDGRIALPTNVAGHAVDPEVDVVALSDDGRGAAGTITVTPAPGGSAMPTAVRVAVRWDCA